MKYEFRPFQADYIDDAARLLAEAYARERLASPNLPDPGSLGGERGCGYFRDRLQAISKNAGVAAFRNGELCGFMVESMRFAWKGQKAAGCHELSHGVCGEDRELLYRLLYQELASQWTAEGRHLHIIGHLAHDTLLKENLYLLGFGAILAEELRDLSSIASASDVGILEDPEPQALLDLQREHGRYYRGSPIFLRKDNSDADILSELQEHLDSGHKLLAGLGEDEIVALFIVGESASEGEGLLLRQTHSAQLKSAYIRPSQRGKGIGSALLDRAITWARERGYERMFVEHETANIPGSAFWGKYFEPYVYISMRYVDNTL